MMTLLRKLQLLQSACGTRQMSLHINESMSQVISFTMHALSGEDVPLHIRQSMS